jgi:hypothetical protein
MKRVDLEPATLDTGLADAQRERVTCREFIDAQC